jgi:hypothetical protein
MLGIQKPKDTLVVCKRALTKIDKLAQKTTKFPDLDNNERINVKKIIFALIVLLSIAITLYAHDAGNGPFPQFYVDNFNNLEILSKYIGLNIQRPISGLHYYYYHNSTAQQIIANLMDYNDISVQLQCLGVIGHCAKAPLSENVRKQMINSLKRMCKQDNVRLRANAAYCIGINNFHEATSTIVDMIDDKNLNVLSEVFNALDCMKSSSAKDKVEARLEKEQNKKIRNMLINYLKRMKNYK